MRAFSYACSLPVTWQRWRLHQSIRRTEKPMLHANITAICLLERELLPIEVLRCGNSNFRPFWLLWPWSWPDDLHVRTRSVVHGDIQRVQIWTSFVKDEESYRLTDIHTDRVTDRQTDIYRHDQNYIRRRFAGGPSAVKMPTQFLNCPN